MITMKEGPPAPKTVRFDSLAVGDTFRYPTRASIYIICQHNAGRRTVTKLDTGSVYEMDPYREVVPVDCVMTVGDRP